MSLKTQLKNDLAVFFNIDEFAYTVEYHQDGNIAIPVAVQFFDEESDLGDSMMRRLSVPVDKLPTLSRRGYFAINGDKYGVVDFMPDEEGLIFNVILQKGML